ncbi:DNA polymerase III, subunit gamma and tau [candidate division WWE3 bacterium CG_4_10_14_0_2_um_filter_41_14]|uniref:DNA polymerase III subunit gamma/tau n=1 Tax=candidate division WWE3 bacterium CG_4_10_14_0_2_um_filter_41_14 TaxID=1975072 RepID=A0A2M7TEG4_UNCKA|nr:MAG: DNA polymerase III, subunit gamma and tau [candidate division WWE3 bacterium CG_4_10_14_0_2_um_filter_41_14]
MDEVLYRKYRPQSFDDVYGQDHVKTVLIQSIKHQKVSHAYLFSGPRGSGKTTVARIMSRELGVSGVDVSEIDAASHRGIDDVRNLRESVSFQPTGSERKMYILDEVHMLTNEAFNALLKTLEEPPAHAFFILCTTEPHKVPQTILSRCMHLPFKKATTEQLAQFIIEYSKREGVRLHPDSATLLAAHADGAYRDALVLLEKVIGLCIKGEVSPSDIEKRVGIVGQDFADDLLKDIEQNDAKSFYNKIHAYSQEGGNVVHITSKLVERVQVKVLECMSDSVSGVDGECSAQLDTLWELLEAQKLMNQVSNPLTVLVASVMNIIRNATTASEHKDDTHIETPSEFSNNETSNVQPVQSEDSSWNHMLLLVKEKNKTAEALLKSARLVSVDDGVMVVAFSFAFHKSKVETAEICAIIEDAAQQVYGKKIALSCVLTDQTKKEVSYSPSCAPPSIDVMSPDALLSQAHEVFGGQMIE